MEKYLLEQDINVFYVTAVSFPNGILDAYKKLGSLLAPGSQRKFFGISNLGPGGQIIYKAAVEEAYDGEAAAVDCPTLIIPNGTYTSKRLNNWRDDPAMVGTTFEQLLAQPGIDKNGFCLEIYPNDTDMICMVKLVT